MMSYAHLAVFCLWTVPLVQVQRAHVADDYVFAFDIEDNALRSFALAEWNGVLYAMERSPKIDAASKPTLEVLDPRTLVQTFRLETVKDSHLLEINKRFLSFRRVKGVLQAVLTDAGADAPAWSFEKVSGEAEDVREISTSIDGKRFYLTLDREADPEYCVLKGDVTTFRFHRLRLTEGKHSVFSVSM